MLGRVEAAVRLAHGVERALARLVRDKPDRHREAEDRNAELQAGQYDRSPHPVGDRRAVLETCALEEDAELLAAQPRREIVLAHARPDVPGDELDDFVADGVAEPVVDRLEMVAVEIGKY